MRNFTFIINKMQDENSKKLILKACSIVYKKLKKDKSNYMIGLEYNVSTSLLNLLERGLKDPQLTTIFKLAQIFNIKPSKLIEEIENAIDGDINLID